MAFQDAMLFSLQYNSYLFDEVTSSGVKGILIQPIIEICRVNGDKGKQMLLELREWWNSSSSDISLDEFSGKAPRKKRKLTTLERLAYEREQGANCNYISFLDKLDKVLIVYSG